MSVTLLDIWLHGRTMKSMLVRTTAAGVALSILLFELAPFIGAIKGHPHECGPFNPQCLQPHIETSLSAATVPAIQLSRTLASSVFRSFI